MAKITISGLAGTGTSSTGKTLASRLGYKFMSNGDFARNQAKDLGITLNELDELSRKESTFDINRDNMIKKFGEENVNFVLDGRLCWYFVPDSFKVKLYCDFDRRVERVARRDRISFDEAKENTIHREEAIAERFEKYYQLGDFENDSHFDLVIDTGSTRLEEVIKLIEKNIK